jgi:hypothetical protein
MSSTRLVAVLMLAAAFGCTGSPEPASLEAPGTLCAQCQRAIVLERLASQVVSPGGEVLFFDDLQCLADYLVSHTTLPRNTAAFVTDYRSGEWTSAVDAVFTRVMNVPTPRSSHVIAHASPESRDQDPAARDGVSVAARELFPLGAPDGTR